MWQKKGRKKTLESEKQMASPISYLILDFLVRQPIDDCLFEDLFLSFPAPLPFSSCHSLHKAVLLRSLRQTSADVSEQTLHALERIEEIERDEAAAGETAKPRPRPLPSLKAAYCAAATECTLRKLRHRRGDRDRDRESDDFSKAVFRIWNCRVADLQQSDAAEALSSPRLVEKSVEMEDAVGNSELRDRLLLRDSDAKEVASKAITAYVNEALERIGPSWLELKASKVLKKICELVGSDKTSVLEKGTGNVVSPQLDRDRGDAMPMPMPMPPPLNTGAGKESSSQETTEEEQGPDRTTRKEGMPSPSCLQKVSQEIKKNVTSRFKIKYSKNTRAGPSKKHYTLSTPEVDRAVEALKLSCKVLHNAVEDPLPSAIAKAAELVESMAGKVSIANGPTHNLNSGNSDLPGPSSNQHADLSNEVTTDRQCHVDKDKNVRPSLMDRCENAQTFEWEDSIESISEASESSSKRVRLPSPKKRRISPINIPKPSKYARRRPFKRWSVLEEDTLRESVKKHGRGNWKFILSCYPSIFVDRTEVDLKDKWRNMTRYTKYDF